LRAEGQLIDQTFRISMKAENELFRKDAAGSPFTVYAPGNFADSKGKKEACRNWAFAVKAGDEIQYEWPIKAFEDGKYQLYLHGPNGFYREFEGSAQDPQIQISAVAEVKRVTKVPTGNIALTITNVSVDPITEIGRAHV